MPVFSIRIDQLVHDVPPSAMMAALRAPYVDVGITERISPGLAVKAAVVESLGSGTEIVTRTDRYVVQGRVAECQYVYVLHQVGPLSLDELAKVRDLPVVTRSRRARAVAPLPIVPAHAHADQPADAPAAPHRL
jgi:hypothetical protein